MPANDESSPTENEFLYHILIKIQALKAQNQRIALIFDLDSTLFDVSPRLEFILREFAGIPSHQEKFPEEMIYFKQIKAIRTDWGIRKALVRAGLTHANPALQDAVRDFWRERFFSNEYLQHDVPYEGAQEFVQKASILGADIFYLTGRDVHRMGKGSRETLLKWGFPLDDQSSQLILKPFKGMDDGLFKRDWFMSFPRHHYQKIWFFENEPVNVNLIHEKVPNVEIVFFDSAHSGKEHPPENITKIMNFLCTHPPMES